MAESEENKTNCKMKSYIQNPVTKRRNDHDRKLYKRYSPLPRRVISLCLLIIVVPSLCGLDVLTAEFVQKQVASQTEKQAEHEYLRKNAAAVLHLQLMPQLRKLVQDLKRPAPEISHEQSKKLGKLREKIRRLRLALLDNLNHDRIRMQNQQGDKERLRRLHAFHERLLQLINRLDASCLNLCKPQRQIEAIQQIIQLTQPEKREQQLPTECIGSDDDHAALQPVDEGNIKFPLLGLNALLPTTASFAAADPTTVVWPLIQNIALADADGSPTAADLMICEPQLSDSAHVQALVEEFPTAVAIFEYFRNHFKYEPYFGAVKGAERTLCEQAGNDVDLASAMISVLRCAGIPCRYVYGTVRLSKAQTAAWLGVAEEAVAEILRKSRIPFSTTSEGDVLIDHVWVKVFLDFFPYRGTTTAKVFSEQSGGSAWIELDPSFKQHTLSTRRNLETQMGFNSNLFWSNIRNQTARFILSADTGLWTSTGDNQSSNYIRQWPRRLIVDEITHSAAQLAEFMVQNKLTTETIFQEKKIETQHLGLLPCADLYKIEARGFNFAEWPAALSANVSLKLSSSDGSELFMKEFPLAMLLDQQLEINYLPETEEDAGLIRSWNSDEAEETGFPAYLVKVVPVLKLNGTELVRSPRAVILGSAQHMDWFFQPAGTDPAVFPGRTAEQKRCSDRFLAGENSIFVFSAGTVTDNDIADCANQLDNAQSDVNQLLYAIGMNFFYQAGRLAQIAAGTLERHIQRSPSLIRVTAGLQVEQLFGNPYRAAPGPIKTSLIRDAWTVASASGNRDARATGAFLVAYATAASVLTGNILHQLLGISAFSPALLVDQANIRDEAAIQLNPLENGGSTLFTAEHLPIEARLPHLPQLEQTILDFTNAGYAVTFLKSNEPSAEKWPKPLIVIDPATGANGFFLLQPDRLEELLPGSETQAANQLGIGLPDLLQYSSLLLPDESRRQSHDWMAALPDATVNTGIAFLPAVAHLKNNLLKSDIRDSTNLALSALNVAVACTSFNGRIEEISAQPGIVDVIISNRMIAPGGNGVRKLNLQARILRATTWAVHILSKNGTRILTFDPNDNQAPFEQDSRRVLLEWDGCDPEGNPLPDDSYLVQIIAEGEGGVATAYESITVDNILPLADLAVSQLRRSQQSALQFSGTADDKNLQHWTLWRREIGAAAKIEVVADNLPVLNGNFCILPETVVPAASYEFGLTVLDNAGNEQTVLLPEPVIIKHPPPETSGPSITLKSPILDPENGILTGIIPLHIKAFDVSGVAAISLLLDAEHFAEVENQDDLQEEIDCNDIDDGKHVFSVSAVDTLGNKTALEPIVFYSSREASDKTPPSLSLTFSSSAADLTEVLSFAVQATDNVGIKQMQILLDGVVLQEAIDPVPAELAIEIDTATLSFGQHNLTAAAADLAGNTTTTAPVPFFVKSDDADFEEPSIHLAMPDRDKVWTGQTRIRIRADDNVAVESLKVKIDGVLKKETGGAKEVALDYMLNAASMTDGQHALEVIASDPAGNQSTTGELIINTSKEAPDTQPPSLTLFFPKSNGAFTGKIPVRATASDNNTIENIVFKIDGAEFAATGESGLEELNAVIDAAELDDGEHIFSASTIDSAGNIVETEPVQFQTESDSADTVPPFYTLSLGTDFELDSRKTDSFSANLSETLSGDLDLVISAQDNVQLELVELFLDGQLRQRRNPETIFDTIITDVLKADDLQDGKHTLVLNVADAAGNHAPTAKIQFATHNDYEPPQIELLTNVADDAESFAGDIRAQIRASDNRGISSLELYVDDELFESVKAPDPAELICVIPAESIADGTHTLQARAEDPGGNEAFSDSFSFVSNNPVSGFKVVPEVVTAATGTTLSINAVLREKAFWTLSFQGPEEIPKVEGYGTIIDEYLDAESMPDGNYTARLLVHGIDLKPTADFEVNLVTGPPVAEFADMATETLPDGTEAPFLIQDGLFEVTGTVDDPDPEDEILWNVTLHNPEGAFVAQLLPAFRQGNSALADPDWASSRIRNELLGTLDFTTLRNGIYLLRLNLRGGDDQVVAEKRISLNSQLKIGQFGFSQQDLLIPVSGIPISVIRTYNSIAAAAGDCSADFAPGWTYAIADVEMELDETRALARDESGHSFSKRTGGGRNVTITLPDGKRITFQFKLTPPSMSRPFSYAAEWIAPPGVNASLKPLQSNKLVALPNLSPYWEASGPDTPMEAFEFSGFRLTMGDGSQYQIERKDAGSFFAFNDWTGQSDFVQTYGDATLRRITQHGGDVIEFRADRSGIDHFNASGDKTKSIAFERDAQGRIAAVYDPQFLDADGNALPDAVPAVKYEYDDAGNLIKVQKLREVRTESGEDVPVYDTVEYIYGNEHFPHHITDIKDPRGITPMRAEYDERGRITATVDANGNRIEFERDVGSRTETVYDRLGNPTTYIYDERGNVTVTIDAHGNRTTRTYDSVGNELTVTDPLGNTTTYTYDGRGNRTSVTDALGNTTRYKYDAYGNQLAVTDPLGNTTSNQYDNSGNLISSTDALGQTSTYDYDSNGNIVATYDSEGNLTASFNYNSDGNPESITGPDGVTRYFTYDANGNQTSSSFQWVNPADPTDIRDLTTYADFDGNGRVTRSVDAQGNVSCTEYSAIGKPVSSVDSLGNVTKYRYDARGNLIETQHPDGTVTRTVYDANGRSLITTDRHRYLDSQIGPDGPAGLLPNGSRTVYDANGRAVVTTDRHEYFDDQVGPDGPAGLLPNGSRTVYDSLGRVVRSERLKNVVIDLLTETSGTQESYRTFFKSADAVISATENSYDPAGRLREAVSATGVITRYEYDKAGRQTAVLVYPYENQNTASEEPGPLRTEYEYDAAGRQILVRDPLGRETRYAYDALGRRIKTILSDGTYTTTTYDSLGRRIAETDQDSLTRNFEYDAQGRLTAAILPEVEDPENNDDRVRPRYEYEYSTYGRLVTIRDPKGRETHFTYDAFGRQLSRTLPMGQTEFQTYDQLGQLESQTDFKGQITEFVYDSQGRLTDRYLYPKDAQQPEKRISVVYDELGRQTQILETTSPGSRQLDRNSALDNRTTRVETSDRTTQYTYDSYGQLVTVTSPEGTINYEYDEFGRKTRTFTANSDVRYDYDSLGRLTAVSVMKKNGEALAEPEVTTYAYTEIGTRESQILPNGVTTLYQYDELNRLTNLSHYNPADEILASYSYTIAPSGRRTAVAEKTRQPDNTLAETVVTYTYDQLCRLTEESYASADLTEMNFSTQYSYDLVGNRLEKTTSTGERTSTTSFEYNANDQLVTETASDAETGVTNYSYDLNGSLISKENIVTQESCAYSYNLQNQLVQADIQRLEKGTPVAITLNYGYNTSGFRTRADSATRNLDTNQLFENHTTYLPDEQNLTGYTQVLEEYTGSGLTKSYTIADDVLAQTTSSGKRALRTDNFLTDYFLTDGHGSTRLLTNATGTVTGRFNYDAFGTTIPSEPAGPGINTSTTALTYSGEWYDTNLQQQYLRARWYSPQTAAFSSLDPYSGSPQDPQSLNKYAYCHNDPINGIDPSGMKLISLLLTAGIVGSLAGVWGAKVAERASENRIKGAITGFLGGASLTILLTTKGVRAVPKLVELFTISLIGVLAAMSVDLLLLKDMSLNTRRHEYAWVFFETFSWASVINTFELNATETMAMLGPYIFETFTEAIRLTLDEDATFGFATAVAVWKKAFSAGFGLLIGALFSIVGRMLARKYRGTPVYKNLSTSFMKLAVHPTLKSTILTPRVRHEFTDSLISIIKGFYKEQIKGKMSLE